MIKFSYIIGANIELFVMARYIKADPETSTDAEVEIIEVKDSEGLDVETDDILIDGDRLDFLLEVAAFEAHSEATETSTNRVLKHRKEAAKKGLKRKEYLVSDAEHKSIWRLLHELRGE